MRVRDVTFTLLLCGSVPAWGAGSGPGRDPGTVRGAWHTAIESRGPAPSEDVARALDIARAKIAIGAFKQVGALLAGLPRRGDRSDAIVLRLRAVAEFAQGRYAPAAVLFAAAADRAVGKAAGVLDARAGHAFELAGATRLARVHYRRAARRLPEIRGWLAVREARLLTDTAAIGRLLGRTGPAGRALAASVWADALLRAGDTAGAVAYRARAGRPAAAASLALAMGDRSTGRRLLYQALRAGATENLVPALEAAMARVPPVNPDEVIALAGALRRVGRLPDAARMLRDAVSRTGNAWLLIAAAEAQADAGDRAAALATLELAVSQSGRAAGDAAYARARMLLRVRGEQAGVPALLSFARRFPEHPAVPTALFLLADARERAGDRRSADSLYHLVGSRFPHHSTASQSFLRLAANAERARQFDRARRLLASVRDGRGPDADAARYLLGRVALQAGDTAAAVAEWTALASGDSLGYYALLARDALALPSLRIERPTWPDAGPLLRRAADQLALLKAAGFSDEADALVDWASHQLADDAEQLVAFGRWLLDAGYTEPAVNLGWRASRRLGLHDARVLRLVFPWPLRDLVESEAQKFNLDPYLLAGLIRQESLFRSGVVSRAGAVGLMQLMPGTALQVARRLGLEWQEDLLAVADANLHVGAAHLSSLLRRYRGNEIFALAAYNAGGRPVDQWRQRWTPAHDWVQFVERIPYPETRAYVRTVVRNRTLYRALYPATDPP